MRWVAKAFRHNPSRLAAERAVVIAVYEDAKKRRDTRAMNAAQAKAYVATITELRATVRGAGR